MGDYIQTDPEEITPLIYTPPVSPLDNSTQHGGTGGTGYGSGYGSAGYGSDASLDHVRTYPEEGTTPRNDGTLTYPSDITLEQAANLAPISKYNADTTVGKRDKAMKMYEESDKSIEAIREAKQKLAHLEAPDWQTQRMKNLAALSYVVNSLGTGLSGSGANQVAQYFQMLTDIQNAAAINTIKKNINQAYIDEAEAKQQNQNSRNELDIDTWSALRAILSDHVAQLSSLNPSLVSGLYGSEANKTWNDETPEDERPSRFLYQSRGGNMTPEEAYNAGYRKPEDMYRVGERTAVSNENEDNYRFLPLVDRTGKTLIEPSWWTQFEPQTYEAIKPQQVRMFRKSDENAAMRALGSKGRTSEGQSASKEKNLAPYLIGYQNRS